MTPYEKLEAAYARADRIEPFLYYVRLYAAHGFVFIRPDFVAIGRPVRRDADPARILDDQDWFRGEQPDCWYLFAAAGNMARMWQVVPFELDWFCWTRLSDPLQEVRFVRTETLKRLCPPDLACFVGPESPKSPSPLQPMR